MLSSKRTLSIQMRDATLASWWTIKRRSDGNSKAGVKLLPGRGVEFRDPSGNRVQIVEYAHIQFTKRQAVLDGMGCADLHKSREAIEELARKGMTVKEN